MSDIQLIVKSILIQIAPILLFSIGFYLTFKLTKIYHFGLGAIFTLSPYLFFTLLKAGLIPEISIPLALLLISLITWLVLIYYTKSIIFKSSNPLIGLVIGLGIYTFITNSISLIWGDSAINIHKYLNMKLWVELIFATLVIIVIVLVIKFTNFGRNFRGLSSDFILAKDIGIPITNVLNLTILLTGGLVGFAGIQWATQYDLKPDMGMSPQMLGVISIIIGGNTFKGTILGVILLISVQQVAVLWIPSKWQESIAFMLLLLILIFKPNGILGKRP